MVVRQRVCKVAFPSDVSAAYGFDSIVRGVGGVMIRDEDIDVAVLASITNEWQKLAFVVGKTMMQIESSQLSGRDDLYFAGRIRIMVESGLVEYDGDLQQMRQCEVRLSRGSN